MRLGTKTSAQVPSICQHPNGFHIPCKTCVRERCLSRTGGKRARVWRRTLDRTRCQEGPDADTANIASAIALALRRTLHRRGCYYFFPKQYPYVGGSIGW